MNRKKPKEQVRQIGCEQVRSQTVNLVEHRQAGESNEKEMALKLVEALHQSANSGKNVDPVIEPVREKPKEEQDETAAPEADQHYQIVTSTAENNSQSPLGTMSGWYDWLFSLRAPVALLGAIALVPKIVLLWTAVVIAKPLVCKFYDCCPQIWQSAFTRQVP
ncbi:MAG: hypothetical protein K8F91_03945 [Candidatus Obscuribacterales bacterium]|nr:hypothetical protein [Candidatus Obscuribacterales bacterium]